MSTLHRFDHTQVVPATPGWYAYIKDEAGISHYPVAAWAANKAGQMLPIIDAGEGYAEISDYHTGLVYSPTCAPVDTEAGQ